MNLWKTKLFTQSISTNTFHTKITLNYSGCARKFKASLGEYLQTLGKALARWGTYKQIADAAFHCPSLKTYVITNTLQALGKECNDLCSKKNHLCYVGVDQMKWRTFPFSTRNKRFESFELLREQFFHAKNLASLSHGQLETFTSSAILTDLPYIPHFWEYETSALIGGT